MRILLVAGALSAAYLVTVALSPSYRDTQDPALLSTLGWRACLSEEYPADSCAPGVFLTLAACETYNGEADYDSESAACFPTAIKGE